MLEIRPNCECCDRDLAPEAVAYICTFECTWCAACIAAFPKSACPNCGGNLQPRPVRPHHLLNIHPASTKRILATAASAQTARDGEQNLENLTSAPSTFSAILNELAHAVAVAPDTLRTRTVLARVVYEVEAAAGVRLGSCEHDPLIVLQRRFGRAHEHLPPEPTPLTPARMQDHIDALRNNW